MAAILLLRFPSAFLPLQCKNKAIVLYDVVLINIFL